MAVIRGLPQQMQIQICFIFHYGSKAFNVIPEKFRQLLITNREKLKEKYGMDLVSYSYVESALIDMGVTNVRNQDFLEEDIENDQKFDVVIFDEVLNL